MTAAGAIGLIGGTGRSGTTVLKRILQCHQRVAIVPEWRFTIDPDGLISFLCVVEQCWSPYVYDLAVFRLEKLLRDVSKGSWLTRAVAHLAQRSGLESLLPIRVLPRYSGLHASSSYPGFGEDVSILIEDLRQVSYRGHWTGMSPGRKRVLTMGYPTPNIEEVLGDFWRRVISGICEHQGKSYYVEDNTWNILYFDKLLRLLPEARLIHIYRDPRDVVASYVKMSWAPSDARDAAVWYTSLMERWLQVRERVDPGSFLEVRLEDIVRDPRSTMVRVLDFLDIEWSDVVLRLDLSESHSGRWLREFTPTEAAAICEVIEQSAAREYLAAYD